MAKSVFVVLALVLVAQAYAALPNGAKCTRDSNCNNRCYKGTCTSEVGLGGTCDYKWECMGALVCRERKCVRKGGAKNLSALKSDGAVCMSNKECKNICMKDRCQSRPRAGGFCDRSDQCYGKLVCRNGKCQKKKGDGKMNGKKCRSNYECINICFAGYCRNARYFGQSCYRNIHCKEDLVCLDRSCRSRTYTTKKADPVAIPRPAKRKAPTTKGNAPAPTSAPAPVPAPAPTPTQARVPRTRSAQPKKVPVAAPAPAPAPASTPAPTPAPKEEENTGVFTKEGKTPGAQAAIQKSKEEKEEPTTIGLLRSGPGAQKKPDSRSNIMKFFFCMVHKDEC